MAEVDAYLWGAFVILAVFLLNQVIGRMIARMFTGGERHADLVKQFVPRTEHTTCTMHTGQKFDQITKRLDDLTMDNRAQHTELFQKLDGHTATLGEIKGLLRTQNGSRPVGK